MRRDSIRNTISLQPSFYNLRFNTSNSGAEIPLHAHAFYVDFRVKSAILAAGEDVQAVTSSAIFHCRRRRGMSEVWNRFGPTAARSHGKPCPAIRPSSMTIDVHSHVAVTEVANFVKPHLKIASMPLVNFATSDTRALIALGGARIAEAADDLFEKNILRQRGVYAAST